MESLTGNVQPRHLISSYTHLTERGVGEWGSGSQSFPLEVVRIVPGDHTAQGIPSHFHISKNQCSVHRTHWESAHWASGFTGKTQLHQKAQIKGLPNFCIRKHPLHQLRGDRGLTKPSEQFKLSHPSVCWNFNNPSARPGLADLQISSFLLTGVFEFGLQGLQSQSL